MQVIQVEYHRQGQRQALGKRNHMGTLPRARDIQLLYRKGRNEAMNRETTINAGLSASLFFFSQYVMDPVLCGSHW